jgi:hypothetical protein
MEKSYTFAKDSFQIFDFLHYLIQNKKRLLLN